MKYTTLSNTHDLYRLMGNLQPGHKCSELILCGVSGLRVEWLTIKAVYAIKLEKVVQLFRPLKHLYFTRNHG